MHQFQMKILQVSQLKSVFQEKERGSLEVGKNADVIILNQDLMNIDEKDILKTNVLKTFVDGKIVFIDLIYDIENSAPGYLDIKKPKIIENKNPQIK